MIFNTIGAAGSLHILPKHLPYVFPLKTMSMSVYKSGSADSAPQTCYELSLSCVAGKENWEKIMQKNLQLLKIT